MTECDWRLILKDCRDYSRIRCLLAVYLLTPNETTGHRPCSYELEVASKDIAEIMSISRPSVHVLLDALQKEGLIFKEHYGRIVITPPGRKRAVYLKKHIQAMAAAFEESLGTTLLESAALALHCVDMMSAERLMEIESADSVYVREKGVISC